MGQKKTAAVAQDTGRASRLATSPSTTSDVRTKGANLKLGKGGEKMRHTRALCLKDQMTETTGSREGRGAPG